MSKSDTEKDTTKTAANKPPKPEKPAPDFPLCDLLVLAGYPIQDDTVGGLFHE